MSLVRCPLPPRSAAKNSAEVGFPTLPNEDMFAHAANAYLENANASLAHKGLLYVADGGEPAEARAIVDFDLSKLPALPTTHPGYEKRLEIRTRYESQNEANELRRREIRFKAWTALYALVKTATTDAAPMFSRQLLDRSTYSMRHADRTSRASGYPWRLL